MSWAKYLEDNIEIVIDRKIAWQSRRGERDFRVVCKTNDWRAGVAVTVIGNVSKKSDSPYEDKCIVCKDCGEVFMFPADMQKRFHTKGWVQPKRCKRCREAKKCMH